MPGNTDDHELDRSPWSSVAAAQRLRSLLQERGISIARLARELSVTRQTVHRWLQGQHISPGNLQRLSEHFQVSTAWLQNGSDGDAGLQLDQLRNHFLASIADNERRLQLGARASRMVVWEYDLNAGTLHWSGPTEEVLGVSAQELHLNAFFERVHREDRPSLIEAIERLSNAGGNIEELEIRFRHGAGAEQSLEVWGDLQLDHAGRPHSLIGSLHDISRRRRLQGDLDHARTLLKRIQEQVPLYLVIASPDGTTRGYDGSPPLLPAALDSGLIQRIAAQGLEGEIQAGDFYINSVALGETDAARELLIVVVDTAALPAKSVAPDPPLR